MILINDVRGSEELRSAELEACRRVIESGQYVLGTEVDRFETEWARYVGAGYAVGVGNGLDAIEIALRSVGIGPGDEVITSAMTAFATALAVIRSGATTVLADIDSGSAILDPQSVERCITPSTKAVIVVHLYGRVGDVAQIQSLCEANGLTLIEDCAQAHLASKGGVFAGSFGSAAAWSFYPTKNLGAVGDAGALTTAELDIADSARAMRNYGQVSRYRHDMVGLNSRLDEIQAALLRVRLPHLSSWTERRMEIAATYNELFSGSRVRPLSAPVEKASHVYHLFVVVNERRDELHDYLADRGIQSLSHYPVPVHMQRAGRDLRLDPNGLRHSEQHGRTCLSIPCHQAMTDNEVEYVSEVVRSFGS